jgi:predicted permease
VGLPEKISLGISAVLMIGVIFRKYNIVSADAFKTISAITFKITIPFLVFDVLYGLKFTNITALHNTVAIVKK